MNPGIVILEYVRTIRGKNCSFSVFDLIFWAHNVAEPRPEQLKKTQIITLPPQACTVGTRHDGCITSSASLLTLMPPSLWNRLNLDSSDHMTFFHCSRVQSLCSLDLCCLF